MYHFIFHKSSPKINLLTLPTERARTCGSARMVLGCPESEKKFKQRASVFIARWHGMYHPGKSDDGEKI
jgi:hypothetical protein